VIVKIHLEGTLQECEQAAPRLAEMFDVVSISDPYPQPRPCNSMGCQVPSLPVTGMGEPL